MNTHALQQIKNELLENHARELQAIDFLLGRSCPAQTFAPAVAEPPAGEKRASKPAKALKDLPYPKPEAKLTPRQAALALGETIRQTVAAAADIKAPFGVRHICNILVVNHRAAIEGISPQKLVLAVRGIIGRLQKDGEITFSAKQGLDNLYTHTPKSPGAVATVPKLKMANAQLPMDNSPAPTRVLPALKEAPFELMTRALAALSGNFTSIDFRAKMREMAPGTPQAHFQNAGSFLKRRVAEDLLSQIEHNGETFYLKVA